MAILKRANWSEADVLALPHGEHDFFDRKSGGDFTANRGHFLEFVTKATCAFANSGGGHLILGLHDDGVTFDGLPLVEGRTPTREWLEQKLPHLLSYELQDFRVHEVIPVAPSSIPNGTVVLVVDIGDSALAPHQTAHGTRNYYYRQGGHSVIAPHHYLELLRQRVVGPSLATTCTGIKMLAPYNAARGMFFPLLAVFEILNDGRIAAYKWSLYPRTFQPGTGKSNDDYYFGKGSLPQAVGSVKLPPFRHGEDATILPGMPRTEEQHFGLYIDPGSASAAHLFREAAMALKTSIAFRVATETSPGDDILVSLQDYIGQDEMGDYLHHCIEQLRNRGTPSPSKIFPRRRI